MAEGRDEPKETVRPDEKQTLALKFTKDLCAQHKPSAWNAPLGWFAQELACFIGSSIDNVQSQDRNQRNEYAEYRC